MPVFDINFDEYKKHSSMEIDPKNCQIMFNCGYAPPVCHKGNLGVESINGHIKMYVFILIIF